jgi:amino acid transporter
MNAESGLRNAGTSPLSAEDKAERRRMSFWDLFFLAAGGVVGSGWLLGTMSVDPGSGSWTVFSWLIAGAVMLVIAAVMVELSAVVPKTGGLVFLPLQSGGPLLATVVAAAVWVYYPINPATEAAAMVRGLAGSGWRGLMNTTTMVLTWRGIAWAALFILLISAANLLGPRLFLMINNVLTAFKILVPLLVIALLLYAELHPPGRPPDPPVCFANLDPTAATGDDFGSILNTLTAGGVVFAYIGFQGPVDFAGNIRRRGIGEAARLRWAVYAAVGGSVFLYVSLQFVVIYIGHRCVGPISGTAESFYIEFIRDVVPGWAARVAVGVINLDTVLSPAGTAMIFTYVLMREVAALSRAHLTHRGLQKSKYSVIPLASRRLKKLFADDRLDVYWLILIVDFFISMIWLLCSDGNWLILSEITTVLALVVYATPGVVLASLRRHNPALFPGKRYSIVAEAGFVLLAVVFFLAGWPLLWPGITALTGGCLLLFGLPLVAPASRWYDAKAHAAQFRQLRTNPSAVLAAVLFGYFAMSTLASLVIWCVWGTGLVAELCGAVAMAVLALFAFRRLVDLSARYMDKHSPTLPTIMPVPESAESAPPSPQAAIGQSG